MFEKIVLCYIYMLTWIVTWSKRWLKQLYTRRFHGFSKLQFLRDSQIFNFERFSKQAYHRLLLNLHLQTLLLLLSCPCWSGASASTGWTAWSFTPAGWLGGTCGASSSTMYVWGEFACLTISLCIKSLKIRLVPWNLW